MASELFRGLAYVVAAQLVCSGAFVAVNVVAALVRRVRPPAPTVLAEAIPIERAMARRYA
jgi:hypothetical protein